MWGDTNKTATREGIGLALERKARVDLDEDLPMDATAPQPNVQGSFERTPFLHLLVSCLERNLTGTLVFHVDARHVASLLLTKGLPCKAHVDDESCRLLAILAKQGSISPRVAAEVAARKAHDPTLAGQILKKLGAIDDTRLESALRAQLEHKLEVLCRLPKHTSFAYYENYDALAAYGGEPLAIDPFPSLWRGVQLSASPEHVAATLDSVGDRCLRLSVGANIERFHLPEAEHNAAETLRRNPTPISEFTSGQYLTRGKARLLLYVLLITKQLEVVETSASANPARQRIMERAAGIANQDFFQVLDLSRNASDADVQRAFVRLAKIWHPDRLPNALKDLRPVCTQIFARITEAHAALSDSKRRADYLNTLAAGGPTKEEETVKAALEAAQLFPKAEQLTRNNEIAQATALAKKAVALDPVRTDYKALLAWLEAQSPQGLTREGTLAQIAVLTQCLRASPDADRTYYWRGMLLKRIGETSKAHVDFRRAANINPRNVDAIREVRLHEPPSSTKAASSPDARTSARPSHLPRLSDFVSRLLKR